MRHCCFLPSLLLLLLLRRHRVGCALRCCRCRPALPPCGTAARRPDVPLLLLLCCCCCLSPAETAGWRPCSGAAALACCPAAAVCVLPVERSSPKTRQRQLLLHCGSHSSRSRSSTGGDISTAQSSSGSSTSSNVRRPSSNSSRCSGSSRSITRGSSRRSSVRNVVTSRHSPPSRNSSSSSIPEGPRSCTAAACTPHTALLGCLLWVQVPTASRRSSSKHSSCSRAPSWPSAGHSLLNACNRNSSRQEDTNSSTGGHSYRRSSFHKNICSRSSCRWRRVGSNSSCCALLSLFNRSCSLPTTARPTSPQNGGFSLHCRHSSSSGERTPSSRTNTSWSNTRTRCSSNVRGKKSDSSSNAARSSSRSVSRNSRCNTSRSSARSTGSSKSFVHSSCSPNYAAALVGYREARRVPVACKKRKPSSAFLCCSSSSNAVGWWLRKFSRLPGTSGRRYMQPISSKRKALLQLAAAAVGERNWVSRAYSTLPPASSARGSCCWDEGCSYNECTSTNHGSSSTDSSSGLDRSSSSSYNGSSRRSDSRHRSSSRNDRGNIDRSSSSSHSSSSYRSTSNGSSSSSHSRAWSSGYSRGDCSSRGEVHFCLGNGSSTPQILFLTSSVGSCCSRTRDVKVFFSPKSTSRCRRSSVADSRQTRVSSSSRSCITPLCAPRSSSRRRRKRKIGSTWSQGRGWGSSRSSRDAAQGHADRKFRGCSSASRTHAKDCVAADSRRSFLNLHEGERNSSSLSFAVLGERVSDSTATSGAAAAACTGGVSAAGGREIEATPTRATAVARKTVELTAALARKAAAPTAAIPEEESAAATTPEATTAAATTAAATTAAATAAAATAAAATAAAAAEGESVVVAVTCRNPVSDLRPVIAVQAAVAAVSAQEEREGQLQQHKQRQQGLLQQQQQVVVGQPLDEMLRQECEVQERRPAEKGGPKNLLQELQLAKVPQNRRQRYEPQQHQQQQQPQQQQQQQQQQQPQQQQQQQQQQLQKEKRDSPQHQRRELLPHFRQPQTPFFSFSRQQESASLPFEEQQHLCARTGTAARRKSESVSASVTAAADSPAASFSSFFPRCFPISTAATEDAVPAAVTGEAAGAVRDAELGSAGAAAEAAAAAHAAGAAERREGAEDAASGNAAGAAAATAAAVGTATAAENAAAAETAGEGGGAATAAAKRSVEAAAAPGGSTPLTTQLPAQQQQHMRQQWECVGIVVGPHALRGEVKVRATTCNIEARFKRRGASVFLSGRAASASPCLSRLVVEETRETSTPHLLLVKFKGVSERTAAAVLTGATLVIPKQQARADAPPGALLASDVADYFVVVHGDPGQNKIGTVRRIIPKEAAGLRESALPAADDVLEIELYRDVAVKQLLHAHARLPAAIPPAMFSEASLRRCGVDTNQLQQRDVLLLFKCEGCGKKFRSYEKAYTHEQRCLLHSTAAAPAATAGAPYPADFVLQQRAVSVRKPEQEQQLLQSHPLQVDWHAAAPWEGRETYRKFAAERKDEEKTDEEEEEEDCVDVEEQEYKELGAAPEDAGHGVASLNTAEELLLLQRVIFPENSNQIVEEEVDLHAPAKKRTLFLPFVQRETIFDIDATSRLLAISAPPGLLG